MSTFHTGSDVGVSIQPRDGGFIRLGTGTRYQVVPESISYSGDLNEYGCSEASWKMHVDTRFPHIELEHFTPVVIEVGGAEVWSGRIISTPTTFGDESIVTVQAQGWGQHTKDDPIDKIWVVSDLSKWKDARSMPGSNLSLWTNGGTLAVDSLIAANFGQASVVKQNRGCWGVTLDLGPNNVAKRIIFSSSNFGFNAATVTLYARTSQYDEPIALPGSYADAVVSATPATAQTTYRGTFSTGYRYVHIFMYYTGADIALAQDQWVKIHSALVFTDTADETGDASDLHASTVISETLDAACPLFSTDRSLITATTFDIPEYPASFGRKFPNEIIDEVNSYHGYQFRLSPTALPVAEYRAQPTVPSFVVGAGDDYKFDNPSENDGRTVYSRVISEYSDATDVKAESEATATVFGKLSSVQFTNPSFTTNTTGWAIVGGLGTIARSTVTYQTSPGSLELTGSFSGAGYYCAAYNTGLLTGLTPGKQYAIRFQWYKNAALVGDSRFAVLTSDGITHLVRDTTSPDAASIGAWTAQEMRFVAPANGSVQVGLTVGRGGAGVVGYVDTFEVYEATENVVQKRGFNRTLLAPMTSRSTAAASLAIAQLKLNASQTPPFKGSLSVTGTIRTLGGGAIPVSQLPSRVGDIVLLDQFQDVNSGAYGRQGIIMKASYDVDTDTAQIELDDPSDFIDNMLARLSATVKG